jgi:hypothetical protein
MVLQVNVLEDDSAAPLARRPIFGRSAGERLKFGRGAASGWRPVTGTSDWGPEAEPRLRLCPHKGRPPHPGAGWPWPAADVGMLLAPPRADQ